jgi:hypothetical protein
MVACGAVGKALSAEVIAHNVKVEWETGDVAHELAEFAPEFCM